MACSYLPRYRASGTLRLDGQGTILSSGDTGTFQEAGGAGPQIAREPRPGIRGLAPAIIEVPRWLARLEPMLARREQISTNESHAETTLAETASDQERPARQQELF